jgi:hypothetical protein
VGNVKVHWPPGVGFVRRWSCSGLIYIASDHTFERLLRFSIVVEFIEAECSDDPLMPAEKRKNKAALKRRLVCWR